MFNIGLSATQGYPLISIWTASVRQATVAAATGIAMTATRGRPSGGISGGDLLGAHAVVSACVGGGVGGGLRDDELNCSLTSLEKLPDALSEELPLTGMAPYVCTCMSCDSAEDV